MFNKDIVWWINDIVCWLSMNNKDKDKKKSAKIILFPQSKIKKKITKPQDSPFLLKLKEQQTREFIEGSVDEIGFNLLKKFVDMGLKTTKESFTKDLALVIDCIRGLIYRDFDMAHAAQLLPRRLRRFHRRVSCHRAPAQRHASWRPLAKRQSGGTRVSTPLGLRQSAARFQ